jgi:hypothetical protein
MQRWSLEKCNTTIIIPGTGTDKREREREREK